MIDYFPLFLNNKNHFKSKFTNPDDLFLINLFGILVQKVNFEFEKKKNLF